MNWLANRCSRIANFGFYQPETPRNVTYLYPAHISIYIDGGIFVTWLMMVVKVKNQEDSTMILSKKGYRNELCADHEGAKKFTTESSAKPPRGTECTEKNPKILRALCALRGDNFRVTDAST